MEDEYILKTCTKHSDSIEQKENIRNQQWSDHHKKSNYNYHQVFSQLDFIPIHLSLLSVQTNAFCFQIVFTQHENRQNAQKQNENSSEDDQQENEHDRPVVASQRYGSYVVVKALTREPEKQIVRRGRKANCPNRNARVFRKLSHVVRSVKQRVRNHNQAVDSRKDDRVQRYRAGGVVQQSEKLGMR